MEKYIYIHNPSLKEPHHLIAKESQARGSVQRGRVLHGRALAGAAGPSPRPHRAEYTTL